MISLTRLPRTNLQNPKNRQIPVVLRVLLCGLVCLFSTGLVAQVDATSGQVATGSVQVPEAEISEVIVNLPDSQQMAIALATPGLRRQVLLDLAVAAHILTLAEDAIRAGVEVDQLALVQSYLDDRAWLQTLIDRYGWVEPHGSVLDPAAWLLFDELQENDLEAAPVAMPESGSIYQVFQRAGPSLAVANLPNLLLDVEADVFVLWDAFLHLTKVQDSTDAAWKAVETAWFTDRQMLLPPVADESATDQKVVLENIPVAMSEFVLSAVEARPPDSRRLMQLRYSILNGLPALDAAENVQARDQAKDTLYLLSIIDGLHEGRYFAFMQGLLSITFRLLELPVIEQESGFLVDWLLAELPAISAHYAVEFASVDPYLNTAMAATYGVLLKIAGFQANQANQASTQETTTEESNDDNSAGIESDDDPGNYAIDIRASRAVLADAVAQLVLLIPDMAYYFDTPVRGKIVKEIDGCISLAAGMDDNGNPSITRRQFDSCMDTLLLLADRETRLSELSGDMNGPFTTETLRRELSVAPWQRIDYGIGYLNEHFPTNCLPPANVLPNPVEWSVLANVMSWFAERSPEFFNSMENENRISKMRNIGEEFVRAMAEQSQCLAASGTGVNDLISRITTDYEIALRKLDSGIRKAEADFRTQRLKPGADAVLDKDASQPTAYRPDDLVIAPCDAQSVCEMSGNLSTTRALIGLFPDEYLLADQTKMGRIEICYRNMEWVGRRSELVRADDENVSNYFGHLSFDVIGRFVENEQVSDIFGFRFRDADEQLYLFAQSSEEVLNDSCPVEWVGSRTITPLREDRGGMVPNRLTYLAASRKLPSRLLQSNWDKGAEWRDWFVTGIGVSTLELPANPDLTSQLNQHLQALYQAEQTEIYQRIMIPNARNSLGVDVSLYDEMTDVSISKAMLRAQMMLFYPSSLYNSDAIRMAIAGDAGLLDQRTLRRFREGGVPLTSVSKIAKERLFKFREDWAKQAEALRRQGSLSASLKYALTRINILYRQFFILRPGSLQEIEAIEQTPVQDP